MKNLARAVVQSAAFLELSSDDDLDPDVAVSALEALGQTISEMSPAERDALRAATREALRDELRAPASTDGALRFYEHFLRNFCLDVDGPSLEADEARAYWRRRLGEVSLPADWSAIEPGRAASFELELQRELHGSHALFGRTVLVIASGPHPDDLLVAPPVPTGSVYVVHLTWSTETTALWPHTEEFASLEAFLSGWDACS